MNQMNSFMGLLPLLMFLFIPLGVLYMLYQIHVNVVRIRRILERIDPTMKLTVD